MHMGKDWPAEVVSETLESVLQRRAEHLGSAPAAAGDTHPHRRRPH